MTKRLCLLPVLLALAVPSLAHAAAGDLDESFGRGGKVTRVLARHGGEAPPASLAWGPGGRVIVAVGSSLLEYLPDGRRPRGFGFNGKVRVAGPPGTTVRAAGVAVDSRGRILVGGSVNPSTSAFVARYLPDGSPDPSFGQGGQVVTHLGLPTPPPPPNRGITYSPGLAEPWVEVTGFALDAADRPVLTGGWISDWQFCYPGISDTPRLTGFVARLTSEGALDASFDGGVVAPDPAKEIQSRPLVAGNGVLSIGTLKNCLRGSPTQPEMARLGQSGSLDQSFGSSGQASLATYYAPILATDRFGRIVVSGPGSEGGSTFLLQRLSAKGRLDKRFGENGSKWINVPWGATSSAPGAMAVDQRGRPVFAFGARRVDDDVLVVSRRKPGGAADWSFGRKGQTSTRFANGISPTQILIGGNGKVLVAGSLSRDAGYGVGLARYVSGP